MQVTTTRFGALSVGPDDIFVFPNGIVGFETCKRWLLLSDSGCDAIGWLQCVNLPEVALAVVSPRRFVPEYAVRVTRSQLQPLELAAIDQAYVLNILAKHAGKLTLNLRAPILVNLTRRIGIQAVTTDDQPLQFVLPTMAAQSRRAA